MHYLCNKFNLSVVVYAVSVRDTVYVENEKEIKGISGRQEQRGVKK